MSKKAQAISNFLANDDDAALQGFTNAELVRATHELAYSRGYEDGFQDGYDIAIKDLTEEQYGA